MSRHAVVDRKGRKFVYGFDERLSYYFLDYLPKRGGFPRSLVGLLSCPPVYGSACNLLEYLDRYGVPIPEEHRAKLEGDLPV
jgi:hypothetical protein